MKQGEIIRQACVDMGSSDEAVRGNGRKVFFQLSLLTIDIAIEQIEAAETKQHKIYLLFYFAVVAIQNNLRCPNHMPYFHKRFLSETDTELRLRYFECLLSLLRVYPVKQFENAIIPYLLDENAEIRRILCQHSGTRKLAGAVPYLSLLLDDSYGLHHAAANALQSIGTPAAMYALEQWYKRNNKG